MDNIIKVGDYIIVQRQGYTKLHKLKNHGTLSLGGYIVEMDNIIGEKYFSTFQMKNSIKEKRYFTLEKIDEIINNKKKLLLKNMENKKSGIDNRNIKDDGQSQSLTKDDIDKIKNNEFNSNNIVEKLIENSKTFHNKTEYSQEKYIKKKEKKYFEYVQIRRPTIRLLIQLYYRQDPIKILGIRIDDLSQILIYLNIQSNNNYLLYDSGSCGLLSAAIINALGANTKGKLIHMHPGNECQKNAMIAMQYPNEQVQRCINVNLYSILRHYYQNKKNDIEEPEIKKIKLNQQWMKDNEIAYKLLNEKVDGLLIVAKEHPVNLLKELLQFLNGNRNFVIFSLIREPLQDLYIYLKTRSDCISIKLFNNFMRNYQILPGRTHPEINMSNGGYILTGYKLSA